MDARFKLVYLFQSNVGHLLYCRSSNDSYDIQVTYKLVFVSLFRNL